MDRRRFLELAAAGSGMLAGCAGGAGEANGSVRSVTGSTASVSATSVDERTPTDEAGVETATPPQNRLIVAPDGSPGNPGSPAAPLGSIQAAIDRARPGDTVVVRAGDYRQSFETVRSGTAAAPITVTGSDDAVVRGDPGALTVFKIRHSHIHLRGLTLDGLQQPDRPDDPDSYIQKLVHTIPPFDTDDYLEDIVIAPDGMGNTFRPLALFTRTKHLEIGPTEIIGLAGAVYVLGDAEDHTGEMFYLGTPPELTAEERRPNYRWHTLDETRHVHVHHVDNRAGHPHAEMVNTKLGTRDVLVEYCTSLGGSQNTEPYPTAEVRFQSHDATLRWCNLQNGQGHGVHVVEHRDWLLQHDAAMTPEESGTDHAVYGNVITGFGGRAIHLATSAAEQRTLCGNVLTGSADGDPLKPCPSAHPTGTGVGHDHLAWSRFPAWRPVELRFSETVIPAERDPESTDDRELAFRCHRLLLVRDGDPILDVDVGGDERTIGYGGGVYAAYRQGDDSWRWFGGPDAVTDLYFRATDLDSATALQLVGRPSTDGISVSLYRDGVRLDDVTLVGGQRRDYTLAVTDG